MSHLRVEGPDPKPVVLVSPHGDKTSPLRLGCPKDHPVEPIGFE